MDPKELSTLLAWANDGSRTLHYAFAMVRDDGILSLSKHHKGKAILHDLMQVADDMDLRTRRFGTLTVDATQSTITFSANKSFGNRERASLKRVLKDTRLRSYEPVYQALEGADSEAD
jgi:hypothetical protein